MPSRKPPIATPLPRRTLIVDPGAHTIKAGFADEGPDTTAEACHVIPNCIAKSSGGKVYIGPELDKCRDFAEMGFRRPVQKGYLVNWEGEREIWERAFFEKGAVCEVSEGGERSFFRFTPSVR
jgi:actin-related protein 6